MTHEITNGEDTASPPPERPSPLILFVDDEKVFTHMIKLNLEVNGSYQVITENDPRKALHTAVSRKPDLIFLDAVMPELDGFEVLRQLEADPATSQIPVIFLTAISFKFPDSHLGKGVERKIMSKPVKREDLVEAIEEALEDGKPLPVEAIEPTKAQ